MSSLTSDRATSEEVRAYRGQPEGWKGLQVSGKDVTLELGPQVRGFQGKRTMWAKAKKRDVVWLCEMISVCKSGMAKQSPTAS